MKATKDLFSRVGEQTSPASGAAGVQTGRSLRSVLATTLCAALFALTALGMAGCGSDAASTSTSTDGADATATTAATESTASTEATAATITGGETLGEGATEFTFTVVDAEGNEVSATIATDETTVGAALQKLGLIAGDDSEYGLYVKTVNGTTVDYDKDGKYWAFYIDGEYASTGVDSTDVTAGSTYTFKVE